MTPGTLYICATPIGNLEDITLRALRVLREADLIAAEDTRRTVKLLNYYEIKTPLTSYHEHSKAQKSAMLLERLLAGGNIVLVSDAGLPGISDPGAELIALCIEHGVEITICPGATAGICALLLSGLPAGRFAFEGFLPHAAGDRRKILRSLRNERRTMIFYEAPHRLGETLGLMLEAFGDRPAAAARELTKKHEEVVRNGLSGLCRHFAEHKPMGEFVLIVGGGSGEDAEEPSPLAGLDAAALVGHFMGEGMDKKSAIKAAARERGVGKRDMYAALLDAVEEGSNM